MRSTPTECAPKRYGRGDLPHRRWFAGELVREPAFCAWCGAYETKPYRLAHNDCDFKLITCKPCKLALEGGRSFLTGTSMDKRGPELERLRYGSSRPAMGAILRAQTQQRDRWREIKGGIAFRPSGEAGEHWQAEFRFIDDRWNFVLFLPDGSTDNGAAYPNLVVATEKMVESYIHWTSR